MNHPINSKLVVTSDEDSASAALEAQLALNHRRFGPFFVTLRILIS